MKADLPSSEAGPESTDSLKAHSSPFRRIISRRLTMNQANLLFTGIPLGWAGVIGSAVSVMFIGAILLAFLRLYQRRIVFPTDRCIRAIGVAFAFYIVADVISAAFNNHGWATWREVVEDLPFLGFAFVYARLSLSRRQDVLDWVELGAITGAFVTIAIVAVEMSVLGNGRAEAAAGNPGVLAVIASLLYGICLLAATRRHGRMKWIALAAALAAAATILLTGMRALWPFLLIGPVIPLLVLRPAFNWRAVRTGALAAVIPLLAVAYLTQGMVESRVDALVEGVEKAEAGNYDDSVGHRLMLWQRGAKEALASPIVGSGPAAAKVQLPGNVVYSHYHNFLLNAMIRSGILGVLAIIGLFAVPLWVLVPRVRDDVGKAGLSLLLVMYATFLLSGSVGIMLGHDIHDAMFIYGTIVASFLIAGRQTLPVGQSARNSDLQDPAGLSPA